MEERHYFKESQREEIPVPDFKDNITRKLLLQFLCDLCTWAQATPVTSVGNELPRSRAAGYRRSLPLHIIPYAILLLFLYCLI